MTGIVASSYGKDPGGISHLTLAYLPHIDGLRAVAVLSVLGFHAAPSLMPGGFVGVDVFFVISGFLITSILRKEMAQGTFLFKDFLARRARRIGPALAFVVLVSFVLAFFILKPEEMSDFGRSLTAIGLFGANFHFYNTTDYFGLAAQERPLLHTWSLAVEEQFYILWPLLLLFLTTRLSRKVALILIAGAAIASFVLFQSNASDNPTYAFYMPHCRAWELLIGAALALTIDGVNLSARFAQGLAALGVTGIALSAIVLSETQPYPGVATVVATVGTAAVILACSSQPTLVSRALSVQPLVWVGLISYSLYLWHWPVLTFARIQSSSEPSAVMTVVLLVMSGGLAWFSWRYVERPFRGRAGEHRLPVRAALTAAASVLVIITGTGVWIKAGHGWPWRLDAASQTVYGQMATGNPLRRRCDGVENIFASNEACGIGRTRQVGESYDVAVFGDSNADHFVPMIARLGEEQGLSGRQVTQSTCAPLLGVWRVREPKWRENACLEYQKGIIKFVKANPKLKLAILSANWSSYQGKLGDNGLLEGRTRRRGPYGLENFLEPTVRYFTEQGIEVLIIGQVPHWHQFGKLPVACAIEAKRDGIEARACGVPAPAVRQSLAISNDTIRSIASRFANVAAILGTDLTCDAATCYAVMDGTFLYRNRGHLNKFGSEVLARYVRLPPLAQKQTMSETAIKSVSASSDGGSDGGSARAPAARSPRAR